MHHPVKAGPFYILLPINTQPQAAEINLTTLPGRLDVPRMAPAAESGVFERARDLLARAERPVIKAGGGTRGAPAATRRLAEHPGAAVVLSPGSAGVLPDAHPQNMHVGGSKGSISGNFAMEEADLVIFAGSRGVCQADCSGVGYPGARAVLNINGDLDDVSHYANTVCLPGDAGAVADRLIAATEWADRPDWLAACAAKKRPSGPPSRPAACSRARCTMRPSGATA
ncbi:hypothetical protein [Rhodovulum sp.]|uniref:hypothetical protein n=1 Tax=Rhodovulum sp. TaxID=34009 RepID=UPI00257B66C5|nr:hypothetical protein [Rhodovulum sp.]